MTNQNDDDTQTSDDSFYSSDVQAAAMADNNICLLYTSRCV